jgi:hypothetical protein
MPIPPLANVSTYQEAARLGLSVDETVDRLMRYAWFARRAMEAALYWLNPTPEWEVKEAFSLHAYLMADHAQSFRRRIGEMRNPMPDMDTSPDMCIDQFFDEVLTAETTSEKLTALYGVVLPAVLDAYRRHFESANPLVDFPTRRVLRHLIIEQEDMVQWGQAALEAVDETLAFKSHLEAFLKAAGGVDGIENAPDNLPESRVTDAFTADFFPRRDQRFEQQHNFIFPPHEVARTEGVSAAEKTLALMCKRTLEMDVPEAMARMIVEAEGQPWLFYVDMCRQLWDEARHAMMGTVYFENLGIDWKREMPLHPGFAIRLNFHMTPLEAHAALYTIEQSLMPATTGKKYEWETAGEAADDLARLFQDFDWADEVLHVRIGRDWGLALSGMTRKEFEELGSQKLVETEAALDEYAKREAQINWWPAFVEKVLRQKSSVNELHFGTSDPVYNKPSQTER